MAIIYTCTTPQEAFHSACISFSTSVYDASGYSFSYDHVCRTDQDVKLYINLDNETKSPSHIRLF